MQGMMGFLSLSSCLLLLLVRHLVIITLCDDDEVASMAISPEKRYISVLGDPGMQNPNARFALEAWNFCNEVGMEAPNMGSPRLADCADLGCPYITGVQILQFVLDSSYARV
ncbi:unnamed protein product [Ilex paraguariensis]|uniref:DUF7705 domain-containing protein n=1 Tax=Ilex paraguariensis TaxID=185542 RepID=A0ABC8SNA9_9AQUA